MELLGSIFLHMSTVDSDLLIVSIYINFNIAILADWMELLSNLETLRQIGIIIVLSIKLDNFIDIKI